MRRETRQENSGFQRRWVFLPNGFCKQMTTFESETFELAEIVSQT